MEGMNTTLVITPIKQLIKRKQFSFIQKRISMCSLLIANSANEFVLLFPACVETQQTKPILV